MNAEATHTKHLKHLSQRKLGPNRRNIYDNQSKIMHIKSQSKSCEPFDILAIGNKFFINALV
jgi:hypothetical protein